MKASQKQKNIPNGWSISKVDQVFDFVRTCSHSKDQMDYSVGFDSDLTRNIHYGDIHAMYSGYIDISKQNIPVLKDKNEVIPEDKFLKEGDLVVVDASEDYDGVGSSVEIKNLSDKRCIAGLHVFALRDKNNLTVNGYRRLTFKHPIVLDWLKRVSTYSKVYGLSKTSLINSDLILPPLSEQNRIVSVLETWDSGIEKLKQKIEIKKQIKKGLMQELLTGKKRLPGFDDEWEEVRLVDICEIKKGKQLNKEHMIEGAEFPVINGGIDPSGFTNKSNADAETITISEGGNSCGYVNFIDIPFWSGGHCYTLEIKIGDKNFFFQLLKMHQSKIMAQRVGSGLPNIQRGSLESFELVIPQDAEQQKVIAGVLTAADGEITMLEQKLSAWQDQKKYLLNNLVIGKIRTPKDMVISKA